MRSTLVRGGLALTVLLVAVFILASTGAPAALAGTPSLTVTGGGGSNWDFTNDAGTNNGLPAGGTCDESPGLAVHDADIPAGSDAYDNGQMIWVDGSVFIAPGPLSAVGQTVTAGPVSMSGLNVTMEYYMAADTATSRTFVTFANPSGSAINASVDFVTNMGSDDGTVIEATSSGDASFTTADRWVITSDGTPFSDPVITHVLFGPGSPAVTPSSVSQTVFYCSGTEGILATFDITVPAGGTRALMFFNQMNPDDTGAMTGSADFDTNPPVAGDLLDGVSTGQLGEVLNWDFVIAPPEATPTSTSEPTATGTPQPTATIAAEIVAPDTGAGKTSGGGSSSWLIAALAGVALAAAAGIGMLSLRARRT